MSDARIDGYARALFEIARAEGSIDEVEDELFRFARNVENSDTLRTALTDEQIPAARRQAIVEDLLGGKATPTTVQLVSMVVGSGRGRELPAIIDRLAQGVAAGMHHPDVVKRLQADGSEAATSTPAQFRVHIAEERDKWTKVIRNANIRVQ